MGRATGCRATGAGRHSVGLDCLCSELPQACGAGCTAGLKTILGGRIVEGAESEGEAVAMVGGELVTRIGLCAPRVDAANAHLNRVQVKLSQITCTRAAGRTWKMEQCVQ